MDSIINQSQIIMEQVKTMKAQKRGRKPINDKKLQICLYIKSSKIDKYGGMDKVKSKLYDYLKA